MAFEIIEQNQSTADATVRRCGAAEIKRLKRLVRVLDEGCCQFPARARFSQKTLNDLKCIAAAMTIVLTDYGGTTPSGTCEVIAEEAPSLYRAWGLPRVLAACEEIQH